MRLVGYCGTCRRIKYVRVSGHALALSRGGVTEGICSDCEDEEDRKRRERQGR